MKFSSDFVLKFQLHFSYHIQTYKYRDDKGFVEFSSFKMQSPIRQMIHYEIITTPVRPICPESFVILVMDNHVDFLKAVIVGDCTNNENEKC